MQHANADESLAVHTPEALPASFAPAAHDRMLTRMQRAVPQLSRVSDLLLTGVAALLVFADLAVWRTDHVLDTGRLTTSIAFLVPSLGALATIVVALQRRHRVLALKTLIGVSVAFTIASWIIGTSLPPSFAALFALAVLTTRALRHEPAGVAVCLTALAAMAVAAESLRPLVRAAAYVLVLCQGSFGVAVGIGVYLRWSDWRRVAAEEAARTDERLEIARELHDMVGHYVTGIVVQAQAAQHVAERQPAAAAAALERIEIAGMDAMVAMRRMVGGLRERPTATPLTSWDSVDQLLADAIVQGEPVWARIDPEIRRTALGLVPSVQRILTESLTNVRRHARNVTRIDVAVARCSESLIVTVHDDGSAAQSPLHATIGIVGMRERAALLGGSLSAGPAPTGGWLVRADFPMTNQREPLP